MRHGVEAQTRPVDNSYVRRRTFVTTSIVVLFVSYFASVIHRLRAIGAARVVYYFIRNPLLLLTDIKLSILCFTAAINYIVMICVKMYTEERLSRANICAFLFVAMGASAIINTIPVFKYHGTEAVRADYCTKKILLIELVAALLSVGTIYWPMTSPRHFLPLGPSCGREPGARDRRDDRMGGAPYDRLGLLGYLMKVVQWESFYVQIGICTSASMLLSYAMELCLAEKLLRVVSSNIKMAVFNASFLVIFHTYVYNLKYFSKHIWLLTYENTIDSGYNKIAMASYVKEFSHRSLEPSLAEPLSRSAPEAEYVFLYFLDAMEGIRMDIEVLVRNQKSRAVEFSPVGETKIRDLPTVLVTRGSRAKEPRGAHTGAVALEEEKEKGKPSLYNRLPSRIVHSLMFRFLASLLLKRVYTRALILRPVLHFFKAHISALDLYRRKKLVDVIASLKSELSKLNDTKSTELMALFSSWVVLLEK